MRKVLRKIAVMVTVITMIFGTVFIAAGCNGREMEVDGWTLFRFRDSGRVNILNANCESLVVDGVLYIPSRIGRHDIFGFGRSPAMVTGMGRDFGISSDLDVVKIVLAPELHVNLPFWRGMGWRISQGYLRYIEFLCDTFERIFLFGGGAVIYIIPNGSRETLYEKRPGGFIKEQRIYEKSEWLATR